MPHKKQNLGLKLQSTALIVAMLLCIVDGTEAASSWAPTLLVNTEAFQIIDDTDTAANLYIQFGGALNKRLTYDRAGAQFRFDDDLEIYGSASGQWLHAQDRLSSSGSLAIDGSSVYFNSFANCTALETVNGLLTCGSDDGGTMTAGQGITVAGSVVSLTAAHSGTTIEGTTLLSGAIVHGQNELRSSGSLAVDGAGFLNNEVTFGSGIILRGVTYRFPASDGSATGKVLKTDGAGNLSWSTDNGSVSAGQGITVAGSVISLTAAHSGTTIEATTLLSGTTVFANTSLLSSGSLTVERKAYVGSGMTLSGSTIFGRRMTPGTPSSGTIALYARELAGRTMLRALAAAGTDYMLQPSLFGERFIIAPAATTAVTTHGTTTTNSATLSHPTPTEALPYATNFATSTTSGNESGFISVNTLMFRGSTSGFNGFYYAARVIVIDITSVRLFSGLTSASSLANTFGADDPAGHHAGFQFSTVRGDTNWQLMTKDNSTQALANTGIAVSANNVYDLYMYVEPQGSTLYWRVENRTAGTSAEGSTTSNLPGSSTALRIATGVETQTTAARNFRNARIYLEGSR